MKISSRNCFIVVIALLLAQTSVFASQVFTNGNLAILRLGDGSQSLAVQGNTIFIDQYSTNGTLINSQQIPNTGPTALIQDGATRTEGFVTRTPDERSLVFVGYNTNVLASPKSIIASNGATVWRGIGKMDYQANYTLVATTTGFSAGNIRSGCSDGNGNYWAAGSVVSVLYFTNLNGSAGSPTAELPVGGTPNGRVMNVFNGLLWESTESSGSPGASYGVGVFTNAPYSYPTTTNTDVVGGDTNAAPEANNAYDFAVSPDGKTMYIADQTETGITNGGVQKWVSSGGQFVFQYAFQGLTNYGGTGVTVDFRSSPAVIYATTGSNAPVSQLVKVTDTPASVSGVWSTAPVTILATAGTLKTFNGVRFAPASYPSIITQPVSIYPTNGVGTGILSVISDGGQPLTYQWQKGGVNLSNGGEFSGSSSATLTITAPASGDQDSYTCIISNLESGVQGNNLTSQVATVTLAAAASISVSPSSVTNLAGTTAIFTVVGTGEPSPTYLWYSNNVLLADGGNLSGSSTASITLADVAASADQSSYTVVLTNLVGSSTSTVAVLSVVTPPSITTDVGDQGVTEGQNATFAVVAAGSPTLLYQWWSGGSPLSDGGTISGSSTAVLTISSTTLDESGNQYQVIITNNYGSITSRLATLTVSPNTAPPSINQQPQNATVVVGGTTNFSVGAAGANPLYYLWQENGANVTDGNVSGTTTTSVTITGATVAQSNSMWTVIITNAFGAITSSPATLIATGSPPMITTDLTNETLTAGSNALFVVAASGTPSSFSYFWTKGGSPLSDGGNISGSSTATLTVKTVYTNDPGTYQVTVSNLVGTALSSQATLAVTLPAPPVLSRTTAQTRTVNAGGSASFIVTSTNTVGYQWSFNGTNLSNGGQVSGATASTLVISSLTALNTGTYVVVGTNYGGSSSTNLFLTVADPIISVQPVGATVAPGGSFTVSVTAAGEAPLTYQWLQNGSALGGATLSSYTKSGVVSGDAGNYSVIVSNAVGSNVTSTTAAIFVALPATQFYPTNLVVQRLSDGAVSLSADGDPIYLDQFTTNGTYVSTMSIPSTGTNALIDGGAATSEGFLTRSPDGNYLALAGYNTNVLASAVSSSTAWRGIATVSGAGVYNLAFASNIYAGATMRSGATDGKGNYWAAASTLGPYYAGKTATATYLGITGIAANCRVAEVFGTNLYVSSASGNGVFVYNGLPTVSNAPTVMLVDSNSAATSSPYDFNISPYGTNAYIADDGSTAPVTGGILRYDLIGGVWTLSYTLTTGNTTASRCLTVDWSNPSVPVIYAITTESSANRLIQIVDTGAGSGATVANGGSEVDLATAANGTIFRGVKFAPNTPPVISSGPTTQIVPQGGTATFSVTATDPSSLGETLSYQWSKNGTNISGATDSSYSIVGAQASDEASYSVFISDSLGSTTSTNATLTIDPLITAEPSGTAIECATGVGMLSVTATGTALTYQWYAGATALTDDGLTIIGSTTSSLTLTNQSLADTTNYTVVVSGTYGSTTSSIASVVVVDTTPPVVTLNGASTVTNECHTVFTDPGATANSACAGALTPTSSGNLDTNTIGTYYITYSATATSTYGTNFFSITGTAVLTVVVDDTTAPVVSLIGPSTTNVQQFLAYTDPGATANDTCAGALTPVSSGSVDTSTLGTYYITYTATDPSGNPGVAIRTVGVVTNTEPAGITNQPASTTNNAGTDAVFTVGTSGFSLTYQWYKGTNALTDGAAYVGSATASLTVSNVLHASEGSYSVVITNGNGSVTSSNAVLTVIDPVVSVSPGNATNYIGSATPTVFTATGAGTPTLHYQWYSSNTTTHVLAKLSGKTSASFSVTSFATSTPAAYVVVVTNQLSAPNSATATASLVIEPAVTIKTKPKATTTVYAGDNVLFTTAGNNTLQYQWSFVSGGSTNTLAGQTAASLSLTNAGPANMGTYDCTLTGLATTDGGETPPVASAVLVVQTDPQPKVSIVSPKNKAILTNNAVEAGISGSVTNPTMVIDGKLTDKGLVTDVAIVRTFPSALSAAATLFGGPAKQSWTNDSIVLADGTNVFNVFATNVSGNVGSNTLSVFSANTQQLTIVTIGSGTYKHVGSTTYGSTDWTGDTNAYPVLQNTRHYGIEAIPAANCIFSNWMNGATVVSTNPTYTLTMSSGLTLTANVPANPLANLAGVYNGMVTATNGLTNTAASGTIEVTVKSNYTKFAFPFSGKVVFNGTSYALSGGFNLDGQYTGQTVTGGFPVSMNVDWTSGSNQIYGTVAGNSFTAGLEITAPADTLADGAYYLPLPVDTGAWTNYGYATVGVTNGGVKVSGKTYDGGAFTQTTTVDKQGRIPFYTFSSTEIQAAALSAPDNTNTISGTVAFNGGVVSLQSASATNGLPALGSTVTVGTNTVPVLGALYPQVATPTMAAGIVTLSYKSSLHAAVIKGYGIMNGANGVVGSIKTGNGGTTYVPFTIK